MSRLTRTILAIAGLGLAVVLVRELLKEGTDETIATSNGPGSQRPPPSEDERTKQQLYEEAQRLGIRGRSKMNKDQLRRAVDG